MPRTAGRAARLALRAVITAKGHQRIARHPHRTQFRAQSSDLLVHCRDAAAVMLRVFIRARIHPCIRRTRHHRQVRRVKPNDGEKRLLLLRRAPHERNRAIHDHTRVGTEQIFGDAFALLIPVRRAVRFAVLGRIPPRAPGVHLGFDHRIPRRYFRFGRETHVEPIDLRRRKMLLPLRPATISVLHRLGQCAQMPFAEVSRGVAVLLEQFSQRQFLGLHMAGVGKIYAVPKRMPTREATAARGTANRRRRIEPLKPQTLPCHRIEVRSANILPPIETDIAPAQIIAHHEHNVGPFGR